VAREVLAAIGNGARGGDVRRTLKAAPFGWPQDAIDAALMALCRTGSLRATLNGQPVPLGQLDQSRIQNSEFRLEKVRLGTADKIALRGLYQQVAVPVKPGEEEIKANPFLDTLLDLARAAGGDPPLPARPDTAKLEELKRLTGTEQLGAILQARTGLEQWIGEWTSLKQRAEERLPGWRLLERLLVHAATLPAALAAGREVEAIRAARSLLEDTDHVAPIRTRLAGTLRAALTDQTVALSKAWDEGMQTLQSDASWAALDGAARDQILNQVGMRVPVKPSMKDDEELLRELERQSLVARADAIAALPERVAQAVAEAARKLKPLAQRISLRSTTLQTEAEVRTWLAEQEQKLLEAVRRGPVIIS
jgi:hypothetical protein